MLMFQFTLELLSEVSFVVCVFYERCYSCTLVTHLSLCAVRVGEKSSVAYFVVAHRHVVKIISADTFKMTKTKRKIMKGHEFSNSKINSAGQTSITTLSDAH